jgi:hypothetical protein
MMLAEVDDWRRGRRRDSRSGDRRYLSHQLHFYSVTMLQRRQRLLLAGEEAGDAVAAMKAMKERAVVPGLRIPV